MDRAETERPFPAGSPGGGQGSHWRGTSPLPCLEKGKEQARGLLSLKRLTLPLPTSEEATEPTSPETPSAPSASLRRTHRPPRRVWGGAPSRAPPPPPATPRSVWRTLLARFRLAQPVRTFFPSPGKVSRVQRPQVLDGHLEDLRLLQLPGGLQREKGPQRASGRGARFSLRGLASGCCAPRTVPKLGAQAGRRLPRRPSSPDLASRPRVAAGVPGIWHPVLLAIRYLLRQGHGHRLAQLVQTAVNPVPPPLFYHFVGNAGSLRTEVCEFPMALPREWKSPWNPPCPPSSQLPVLPRNSPRKGSLPLHTWVKPALPSFTRVGALPSSLPTCWAALPTKPRLRAKVCGGGHWPGFLPVQESPPSVLPFPSHSEFLYRRSHACSRPCPGPSQVAAGQPVPHRQSARAVQPPRLTLRSLSLSDIPARARPRRGGGAAPSTRPRRVPGGLRLPAPRAAL